jgi:hypothetical protein
MSDCKNCVKCEGEKFSSNCIIWEGVTTEFSSFNELIEALYSKYKAPVSTLDLKTLTNGTDNSVETALQILIDKEVQRVYQSSNTSSTTTTPTCNINVSQLDGCSNCNKSFCEKLQLMVDQIAILKAEINQLKTQI